MKRKHNPIFLWSACLSIIIALWGIIGSDSLASVSNDLMEQLKQHFSWLYLGTMLFFVIFCIVIAFSRYGSIRLGKDNEKPEYSTLSWFAMLFSAGMGIGLVFWSVAEPLSHYVAPMNGVEPQSTEAMNFSIRSCFMHWGLHPWSCYAIIGLALAYFQFRKNEKVLISSIFKPLIGEKNTRGFIGNSIDIFTTVLTVIGVASSFGMGCLQICSGFEHLFSIPNTLITWIIVIIIICFIYLKSALGGVGKGIKRLSDLNLVLFTILLATAFIIGPGKEIIHLLITGTKDYLVHFFPDSLRLSSNGDSTWIQNWRVFYWAWWLSWAPFVGVFIARISKGRTVREFIFGVILIPTVVSTVWFSVFGGMSFHAVSSLSNTQISSMIGAVETALFHVFDQYHFGMILSIVAVILLITFFITSADSATFVLAMLTSDGELEPPNHQKIFWGILIAVVALALILSGGISFIQTFAIVIAFPYLFVLLFITASLYLSFKKDKT